MICTIYFSFICIWNSWWKCFVESICPLDKWYFVSFHLGWLWLHPPGRVWSYPPLANETIIALTPSCPYACLRICEAMHILYHHLVVTWVVWSAMFQWLCRSGSVQALDRTCSHLQFKLCQRSFCLRTLELFVLRWGFWDDHWTW